MSKNNILSLVALGIAAVVFNVVVFTLPITRHDSFWVSYAFAMIALVIQFAVSFFSWNKVASYKSKFLKMPILSIGFAYLIVQTVMSFLWMFILVPAYVPIITGIILLGGYGVCAIFIEAGADEIQRIDEKVQRDVFKMKSYQSDIEIMSQNIRDSDVKKTLLKLSELFKYSDPISNAQLINIELDITEKINVLKALCKDGDTTRIKTQCSALELLLTERNKKIKLLK